MPARPSIPDRELTVRFSRSSGPGGQHVNTTDSRVELSWSLTTTAALTPAQKELAAQRLASRLVDGTLTVVSSRFRSQLRNREAALERLEALVADAVLPERQRRPTRPSRGAERRRRESKTRRSDLKQSRRRTWD